MRKRILLTLLPLLALALACPDQDAAAARLGGGKSFGGKSSYGGSYDRPSPAAPGLASPGLQTERDAFARAAPSAGGPMSRFGGMGGLLGGLLAGGLIGSLLFGGHLAGPGLMDLLLIAGGAWLLFKLLRSRPAVRRQESPAGPTVSSHERSPSSQERAQAGWDALRSAPSRAADRPAAPAGVGQDLPPGFDADEFLAGAKAAYARLQAAWDRRDLADIATFVTPAVLAEITAQAKADPAPGRTDLLLVNARLIEVRREDDQTAASVHFDVLMREDQAAREPSQVREVWHFRRSEAAPGDAWRLDGIQQLA